MIYQEGMTYLQYIEANRDEINAYDQRPFNWRRNENGQEDSIITRAINSYSDFEKIVDLIPEELSREKVCNLFAQDLFLGTIATLLWGWQHKVSPNNFLLTLAEGRERIEKNINSVLLLLRAGNLQAAYRSMVKGHINHIDRIGESYYTKILYFLSKSFNIESPCPLILDSILRYVHCAILIDQEVDIHNVYSLQNNNLSYSKDLFDTYNDYINRMNNISVDFRIDSSEKLEAALFGWKQYGFNINNPRHIVKRYVRNFFNNGNNNDITVRTTLTLENDGILSQIERNLKIRDRAVELGKIIRLQGIEYYLFIGHTKKFKYCELLTKKKGELITGCPKYKDLKNSGFEKEGIDYIYHRLSNEEYESKESYFNKILKIILGDNVQN